ncbi:hypothetical protein E4T56_gene20755 [Termitomyces sp. T112]|nr:hypothetical protein E4T56_gene20755 [Termitomyces sp. T112]
MPLVPGFLLVQADPRNLLTTYILPVFRWSLSVFCIANRTLVHIRKPTATLPNFAFNNLAHAQPPNGPHLFSCSNRHE